MCERRCPVQDVEAELVLQELGGDPDIPDRRDEGERERDAAEVGGDAGERGEQRPDPAWNAFPDHRVGEQKPEESSPKRRLETQPDADLERVSKALCMDDRGDVREGEATGVVLERAHQHLSGGQEQEQDRVDEERNDDQPGERKTPPAGHHVRPEIVCSACDRRRQRSGAPTRPSPTIRR